MLFAGREVPIVKTVTEVLKLLSLCALLVRDHSFSLFGPTLKNAVTPKHRLIYTAVKRHFNNTIYYYASVSPNRLINVSSTNHWWKTFATTYSDTRHNLILIAFSSRLVNSTTLFSRREILCKIVVLNCFIKRISVSVCESLEIRLLYRKLNSIKCVPKKFFQKHQR